MLKVSSKQKNKLSEENLLKQKRFKKKKKKKSQTNRTVWVQFKHSKEIREELQIHDIL